MAGKNVDTEALGMAAGALQEYIRTVEMDIKKMKDAAVDCSDNMGNDIYSRRAVESLESCTKALSNVISEAEDLQVNILKQKSIIENS